MTRERGPNGRFTKGHARVPGSGRKKGQRPKVLQEVKVACEAIIDDPAYRANLKTRAINGELAPAMEVLLWQYAKGKPREERALQASPDMAVQMTKVSVGGMTVVPDMGRSRAKLQIDANFSDWLAWATLTQRVVVGGTP